MNTNLTLSHTSALSYDIFVMKGELAVTSLIPITSKLSNHINKYPGKDLVLDLSAVEYIDSSCIRLLINLKKRMEANNKQLYLLKPSETVLSTLDNTSMVKVLNIIDSIETLEKQMTANIYETFLPYTTKENSKHRINCSCIVCGSNDVIGYLTDQNSFDWRWIEDDPFPTAYKKNSDKPVDFYGLSPIVCRECYMASIKITDFNIIADNSIVIKSTISDGSKNLLAKSIKRRKKMMELGSDFTDDFFLHPRAKIAIYKAYELAEFCARTISVLKKDSSHFDVGYLNYLVIHYAEAKLKEEYINNCRTWFTQAMNNAAELTMFELAVSHFALLISDFNLDKKKEASIVFTNFTAMIEKLPPTVSSEGITSPTFWYKQAKYIWEKEIDTKSSAMKV